MTYIAFCDIILTYTNYYFTKGKTMSVSYNGLWKILIDRNMYRKDLAEKLNISSATIAKMGKGESVSMDVLERICTYLDCNIGDIMSFEKDNAKESV